VSLTNSWTGLVFRLSISFLRLQCNLSIVGMTLASEGVLDCKKNSVACLKS
jgi:hypothetical protein